MENLRAGALSIKLSKGWCTPKPFFVFKVEKSRMPDLRLQETSGEESPISSGYFCHCL